MLILIFVISLALLIFFGFMGAEDAACGLLFIFIPSVIALVVAISAVISARTIPEKIAMYEEENAIIEQQIEVVIENYKDYEHKTFKDCTAESMITLVDLYPDLKSDSLVSKQIDIYLENNSKIKELRCDEINAKAWRWWLYFGGKGHE